MNHAPTTAEVLSAVAAWAAESQPGLIPARLCVYFHGTSEPTCLHIPTAIALPVRPPACEPRRPEPCPEPPADVPRDEKGPGVSQAVIDILTILQEAGRPMTGTRIMTEMARRGIEWSNRTVEMHLARMIEDG